MNLQIRRVVTIAGAVVISVIGTGVVQAQTAVPPERFTAVALNIGPAGHAPSGRLEMTVTHWFTDDDVENLLTAVVDGEFDALREAAPAGYLRMPDGMAYDLLFAKEVMSEDGRRHVIFLTDLVSLSQAALDPGPIVYGVALIELRLNRNGGGRGGMSIISTRMAPHGSHGPEYVLQSVPLFNIRSSRVPPS